jgi:hypothetical protein
MDIWFSCPDKKKNPNIQLRKKQTKNKWQNSTYVDKNCTWNIEKSENEQQTTNLPSIVRTKFSATRYNHIKWFLVTYMFEPNKRHFGLMLKCTIGIWSPTNIKALFIFSFSQTQKLADYFRYIYDGIGNNMFSVVF